MNDGKTKYDYVMLIDDVELDNFINEKMIRTHFFSQHLYVTTSAGGALDVLRNLAVASIEFPKISPKVIFVDINMPIMDGLQFIKAFTQTIARQSTKPKLVVLTSSAAPMDKERTHDISEEIIFLNKPLTKEMLESL
jgi:CheY-like chemotaxis protein